MSESIVNWLMTVFSEYVPAELFVFIISMMPILELRGGLVAAALLDIPVVEALMICIVGNVIPIPFILLLIRPIFAWLKQTRWFRPIVEKLESKAMGKSDQIRKYEFWGLLIFVGIPLPGTGAWTGALIAAMLNNFAELAVVQHAFAGIRVVVSVHGVDDYDIHFVCTASYYCRVMMYQFA